MHPIIPAIALLAETRAASVANGNASELAKAIPGAAYCHMLFPELCASYTASGTVTLTDQSRNVQLIDCGGAGRTVLLPPEEKGLLFVISNKSDAAETLTIKEDAGSTTIETADQNEAVAVWCDGSAWYVIAIFTVAIT